MSRLITASGFLVGTGTDEPTITVAMATDGLRRLIGGTVCPLAAHIEMRRVKAILETSTRDRLTERQKDEKAGGEVPMRARRRGADLIRERQHDCSHLNSYTSYITEQSIGERVRLIRSEPDVIMLEMGWEPQDITTVHKHRECSRCTRCVKCDLSRHACGNVCAQPDRESDRGMCSSCIYF